MSSKRSKGSGASFRKAKRLKYLAADSEVCSKISSYFTAVAPNATPLVAGSVCDHTAAGEMATASADMCHIYCATEHPITSPVAIEPAEPLMTLVPARRLLPPTCSAVELHPDLLDECHPLEHPAIKLPVTTVVCPVECLNEPASFSKDNATEHELPLLNESSASTGTDIGLHIGVSLSDAHKMELLNSSWVPGADFAMPYSTRIINGKEEKRYLKHTHLQQHSFLSYSPSQQGLFCRPCVLFGPTTGEAGRGHQKLNALVSKPLNKYHRLFGKDGYVTNHEATDYHKSAIIQAAEFRHRMKTGVDILKELDQTRSDEANRSRTILRSIVKTILFCGRQNISLRGHRDDGPVIFNAVDESVYGDINQGNFRALLAFRVDCGDKVLESHLTSSGRNATYISKTTQNELISCIGELMIKSVVNRVKAAKYFSVLADETTDAGRKEQLSICVRYVGGGKLCEEFLGFSEVTDLTGHGLGNKIMHELESRNLDLGSLVGQGYDGASSMSGTLNGAHAVICAKHPQATYMHCANHVLNLCISNGSNEQAVRNAMGVISSAATFFSRSAKRTTILESTVVEEMPESRKTRLRQLCETRWVERHDAILTFVELFNPLVTCLKSCLDLDKDTSTSAQLLLNSMAKPEFIVATCVMNQVLAVTKPLSVHLQKTGIDVMKAMSLVDEIVACLDEMRSSDGSFAIVWKMAESLAEIVESDLKQPRIVAKQRNRVNVASSSDQEYFQRSVFYPFLDHVLSELRSRFSVHNTIVAHLWSLIPKFIVSYSFSDLQPALAIYANFLESEQAVQGEFEIWKKRWADKVDCPDTAIDALAVCDTDFFPNIGRLLQITATLPVTSASAERSFSVLKRLKTYLRTTMGEVRLSGLAHMHVQYSQPIDVEAVINHFATTGRARRLNFII